ncbi:MAG: hypothetical protein AB1637_07070 [Elusimicrobiota bacterium]
MNLSFCKRKSFFLASFFLSFIISVSWIIHINEKGHLGKEDNCQFCHFAFQSQLNSDCGNEIIEKPDNFIAVSKLTFLKVVIEKLPFLSGSRAPPCL